MIKLQLLGPLRIRKEDHTLDQSVPKGAKRISLLAYLVLVKPHGYHRRDNLLAMLWPDSGQKSARNSLSNILYHIREALGKDVVLNRGSEEIQANTDLIWCDALAFQKSLNQNDLYEAYSLYKGELLAGFHVDHVSNDFQDWLDGKRESLKDEYRKLCWKLAVKEKESGHLDIANQYAQEAANLTPYSETDHHRFIEFLVATGRPDKAKQVYEKYAERLRSDLDSNPSQDLTRYVKSLSTIHSANQRAETNKTKSSSSSDEEGNKSDRQNTDANSKNMLHKRSEASADRSNTTLFRYTLILLTIALIAWFIGRNIFNQESAFQAGDKSVAVLPFTYINSPDSTDYFSLGITEEILSKLARVADLSVTSRTSVMRYQNSDKSIQEIARELGVSSVVEGSVQRHWDEVRITAQLIDAETDRHLWGDTYDRKIENILDIQSEVAARIANALQTELIPHENSEYSPNQNVDDFAYQIYLQAKHLLDIHEPEGIMESIDLFKESILVDSTFAPAHGSLALAYYYAGLLSTLEFNVVGVEGIKLRQAADLSLQSANKAISINPNVVEAYLAQAIIYQRIHSDWEQSEDKFLKALSLNPNNSDVRRGYGFHLLFQGNIEEALIHMEKAVAVDPLSWYAHHGLGYTYYCARKYEKAILELETSINLGSPNPITKKHLSLALLKKSQELFNNGQDEEAISMIERGSSILDEIWGANTGWKETVVFAAMGNKAKTLQSINENPLPNPPTLYSLLLIGQTDEVLENLENRINFRINRTYVDPIFDSIRDHPRFKQMVRHDLNKNIKFD